MSYVTAVPEIIAAAATDVSAVGSTLSAAHTAAAASTVAVIPAAADEVSASIAHLFSRHAQNYQALAGQAAAFNQQFVQHLHTSAHSYVAAEAANATSLPQLNVSALTALPGQLLNGLTLIWNEVTSSLLFVWNALNLLGELVFLAASAAVYLSWLVLNFLGYLVEGWITALLGSFAPII
ncbi:MAG: PE family protein [Mycobacterium sp.]